MLHRASRTPDSPTPGNVSEYRRYDVRGLRIFLVENLDVPRGGLKVAVAQSVLHPGEVDTLVDEPGRVRVTHLYRRPFGNPSVKPRALICSWVSRSRPAASVEANSRTGKITWPGPIP
jgi:hypothetical protein